MKQVITIEKVFNGYIVEQDGVKTVSSSIPSKVFRERFKKVLYEADMGDVHTFVIEIDPVFKPHQIEDHDCIELGGLLWDKENLSVGGIEHNGVHYFNWNEAMEAAQKQGKRLPTAEEWEALCGLGSTWDDERKGRWFGGHHDTDHKGSLFLPAAGYRIGSSGQFGCAGTNGYYWSSAPFYGGNYNAGNLYFYASSVNPLFSYNRSNGFQVRCVRDI